MAEWWYPGDLWLKQASLSCRDFLGKYSHKSSHSGIDCCFSKQQSPPLLRGSTKRMEGSVRLDTSYHEWPEAWVKESSWWIPTPLQMEKNILSPVTLFSKLCSFALQERFLMIRNEALTYLRTPLIFADLGHGRGWDEFSGPSHSYHPLRWDTRASWLLEPHNLSSLLAYSSSHAKKQPWCLECPSWVKMGKIAHFSYLNFNILVYLYRYQQEKFSHWTRCGGSSCKA